MGAVFAGSAFRAEAGEVVRTERSARMFLGAARAERTEALVVVGAGRQARIGVDVQEETVVAVGAVPVAGEGVAFGHFAAEKSASWDE